MHQTVEHQDNVAIRGMVKKVAHLVTLKENLGFYFKNKEVPHMKFHELKPAEGSRSSSKRIGRGMDLVMVKLLVKVIKVKMLAQAAVYV